MDCHYNNILLASNVATKSDVTPKHGAIITCGGKVISSGYNKNEVPRKRLMLKYGPISVGCRIHAEYDCLYNLLTSIRFTGNNYIRRKKLDIYVARDSMLNSKPCYHCIKILKHFGIKRVYYSNKCNNNNNNCNKLVIDEDKYYICEKLDIINNNHVSHNNKIYLNIYLKPKQK